VAENPANSLDHVSVGIVSIGMYLPEPVLTATDIAEPSGLPEWVVREKLGINQKRMAGSDDHPNQMAIWAAQDGDLMVIVGAGIGYVWGVACVKWGQCAM